MNEERPRWVCGRWGSIAAWDALRDDKIKKTKSQHEHLRLPSAMVHFVRNLSGQRVIIQRHSGYKKKHRYGAVYQSDAGVSIVASDQVGTWHSIGTSSFLLSHLVIMHTFPIKLCSCIAGRRLRRSRAGLFLSKPSTGVTVVRGNCMTRSGEEDKCHTKTIRKVDAFWIWVGIGRASHSEYASWSETLKKQQQ